MLHEDIFKEYLKMFGFKPDNVIDWFPNGLNSIRIVYKNGYTLIFTYNNHYSISNAIYIGRHPFSSVLKEKCNSASKSSK